MMLRNPTSRPWSSHTACTLAITVTLVPSLPNSSSSTLHEYTEPIYGPGYEDRAMGGEARNAQARALFKRNIFREGNRMLSRHDDVFGGGSKRTTALRAEAPHAFG